MADIDSNTNNRAQARVHKHIQVMGGLISFHAALFSTCLWINRVAALLYMQEHKINEYVQMPQSAIQNCLYLIYLTHAIWSVYSLSYLQ